MGVRGMLRRSFKGEYLIQTVYKACVTLLLYIKERWARGENRTCQLRLVHKAFQEMEVTRAVGSSMEIRSKDRFYGIQVNQSEKDGNSKCSTGVDLLSSCRHRNMPES